MEAYPSANIKIVALDLGSGESIRAAAAEILALDIPINVGPYSHTLCMTCSEAVPVYRL